MAFKYVSGAPIKNAVGYALYEKNSDGSLTKIDEKNTRQDFPYAGAITASGTLAQPATATKDLLQGALVDVYPLMKPTVDGPKYYVEVRGEMDIIMTDGSSASAVSFKGVCDAFTVTTPTKFGFTEAPLYENNGVFYFKSNLGDIEVFRSAGDVQVQGVRLTPNAQGIQSAYVVYADDRYKHTDFIEVAALADSVVGPVNANDNNNQFYCVGKLEDPYNASVCVIAFYSAMDYNTCVHTMTYQQIVNAFGTGAKPYLKASQVQFLASLAPSGKEAKFVVFTSSSSLQGEDQVGVGIYFPIYGQYPELADPSPDNLVVKALGDGLIYADSPESNVQVYTG